MFLPLARVSASFCVTLVVRLKTATEKPFDSMLSTRFSPITASPIKPMLHCMNFFVPFQIQKSTSKITVWPTPAAPSNDTTFHQLCEPARYPRLHGQQNFPRQSNPDRDSPC